MIACRSQNIARKARINACVPIEHQLNFCMQFISHSHNVLQPTPMCVLPSCFPRDVWQCLFCQAMAKLSISSISGKLNNDSLFDLLDQVRVGKVRTQKQELYCFRSQSCGCIANQLYMQAASASILAQNLLVLYVCLMYLDYFLSAIVCQNAERHY